MTITGQMFMNLRN